MVYAHSLEVGNRDLFLLGDAQYLNCAGRFASQLDSHSIAHSLHSTVVTWLTHMPHACSRPDSLVVQPTKKTRQRNIPSSAAEALPGGLPSGCGCIGASVWCGCAFLFKKTPKKKEDDTIPTELLHESLDLVACNSGVSRETRADTRLVVAKSTTRAVTSVLVTFVFERIFGGGTLFQSAGASTVAGVTLASVLKTRVPRVLVSSSSIHGEHQITLALTVSAAHAWAVGKLARSSSPSVNTFTSSGASVTGSTVGALLVVNMNSITIVISCDSSERHTTRASSERAVSSGVSGECGHVTSVLGVGLTGKRIMLGSEVTSLSLVIASANIVLVTSTVATASIWADGVRNSESTEEKNDSKLHLDENIFCCFVKKRRKKAKRRYILSLYCIRV